uniref:Uncharacterized protein n=1 Tax=Grammatophora oceanica TaxID=210454 RepID=A0A7S1VJD9_9STRA
MSEPLAPPFPEHLSPATILRMQVEDFISTLKRCGKIFLDTSPFMIKEFGSKWPMKLVRADIFEDRTFEKFAHKMMRRVQEHQDGCARCSHKPGPGENKLSKCARD